MNLCSSLFFLYVGSTHDKWWVQTLTTSWLSKSCLWIDDSMLVRYSYINIDQFLLQVKNQCNKIGGLNYPFPGTLKPPLVQHFPGCCKPSVNLRLYSGAGLRRTQEYTQKQQCWELPWRPARTSTPTCRGPTGIDKMWNSSHCPLIYFDQPKRSNIIHNMS